MSVGPLGCSLCGVTINVKCFKDYETEEKFARDFVAAHLHYPTALVIGPTTPTPTTYSRFTSSPGAAGVNETTSPYGRALKRSHELQAKLDQIGEIVND